MVKRDNEELIPQLHALVGKTIADWQFEGRDYAGSGICLHFTDGTTFTIYFALHPSSGEVAYHFEER